MTNTKPDNQNIVERPEWLGYGAWPYEVRTAHLDGTAIAEFDGAGLEPISCSYTDEGSGPVLLLVHDGMCSYLWVHLIGLLVDRFRVVTLDFPGSGLSPANGGPVGLEVDSRLLEAFVDGLGLDAMTLVAHDLGGGVGLGLATRRPEAINGMVLINTFAWPPHVAALRAMLRLMGSRSMATLNSGTNFMARASSSRLGVGRHFDREQKQAFVGMFRRTGSRRRFHALMGSVMREQEYLARVEDRLGLLADKPVLTIFGQRNDPFGFQEHWLDHFPDAEQMVVPGGYHFPMCEAPEDVGRRILGWHDEHLSNN
jgi:pimeloyl-ACP methyl ester carboxylesterase